MGVKKNPYVVHEFFWLGCTRDFINVLVANWEPKDVLVWKNLKSQMINIVTFVHDYLKKKIKRFTLMNPTES